MRWTGPIAVVVVGALITGCSSSQSSEGGRTGRSADTSRDSKQAPSDTTPLELPPLDQRDDWGDPIGSPPLLPPEKQQLIDNLDPAAQCADDTPPQPLAPAENQRVLQVVRVVAGCLVVESSVVAAGDLDGLAEAAAEGADVVAASEATHPYLDAIDLSAGSPDPEIGSQQWWLDDLNVAGLDALSVDAATPKVRVAVIDSGIDDSNPDLAGSVALRVPWAGAPTGAPDAAQAHGTHVAGIIAAAAANGEEGRGVARHVEFLDVNFGGESAPSVSEMIDWAVDHGADVINMSFCEVGSDGKLPCRDKPSGATAASIAYARSKAVLVFASAGNCGPANYNNTKTKGASQCGKVKNRLTYPAGYQGVIAVGAYGADGAIAGFSTANESVDVSAPGVDIRSTVFGKTTSTMSGTSQASPMVAGAAAALLAHRPDVNPGRILSGLFAITRDAGAKGWDAEFGSGKIDPLAVATRIDDKTPPPSPATTTTMLPTSNGLAPGELVPDADGSTIRLGYLHPTLGPVTITLESGGFEVSWLQPSVRAVVNATGREVFRWQGAPNTFSTFWFAGLSPGDSPAWPVDGRGNVFFLWNPGRFEGLSFLTPTQDGFDSRGTLIPSGDWAGFYLASLTDVDSDGKYEIDQGFQICEPTCADGIYYSYIWTWDGETYSGRSDPPADDGAQLDASTAEDFLTAYLREAGARHYSSAWSMLSGRYQSKYGSYERFTRFWDSINLVGVNSLASNPTSQSSVTITASLWYEKTTGVRQGEIVEVDLVMVNGAPLIDDYRFVTTT